MKTFVASLALALSLVASAATAAESVNTYQVTGPIVELTATKIVVQKNDEKWEIARDGTTKVEGNLKKGAKVTVHYRMTATKVEVKPADKP
jgi:RNase P/RNase MRP subunit p29